MTSKLTLPDFSDHHTFLVQSFAQVLDPTTEQKYFGANTDYLLFCAKDLYNVAYADALKKGAGASRLPEAVNVMIRLLYQTVRPSKRVVASFEGCGTFANMQMLRRDMFTHMHLIEAFQPCLPWPSDSKTFYKKLEDFLTANTLMDCDRQILPTNIVGTGLTKLLLAARKWPKNIRAVLYGNTNAHFLTAWALNHHGISTTLLHIPLNSAPRFISAESFQRIPDAYVKLLALYDHTSVPVTLNMCSKNQPWVTAVSSIMSNVQHAVDDDQDMIRSINDRIDEILNNALTPVEHATIPSWENNMLLKQQHVNGAMYDAALYARMNEQIYNNYTKREFASYYYPFPFPPTHMLDTENGAMTLSHEVFSVSSDIQLLLTVPPSIPSMPRLNLTVQDFTRIHKVNIQLVQGAWIGGFTPLPINEARDYQIHGQKQNDALLREDTLISKIAPQPNIQTEVDLKTVLNAYRTPIESSPLAFTPRKSFLQPVSYVHSHTELHAADDSNGLDASNTRSFHPEDVEMDDAQDLDMIQQMNDYLR